MKSFLSIVLGAVLLFIAGSMLEERDTFSGSWFSKPVQDHGPKADRRDAANAVYLFRSVSTHLYASGGDARFAERLPATQQVVEELRADIDYVRKNGRVETPKLVRIEFVTSDVTEATRAEVTTREFWVTQHHWPNGAEADPPRSDIAYARYRLNKDGTRWIVNAWDPVDAPEEPAP